MFGWRARLGFLVPPGNPTMEPEMAMLAVPGVSQHFTRMYAEGTTGSLAGQEERNRQQIAHVEEDTARLVQVKPNVVVLGHTATSYTLGREGERELCERMAARHGIPFVTAFGSVVAALEHLGAKRVAYAAPYNEANTLLGKAHLETFGFMVPRFANLQGVTNIYDETPERAYQLARSVNVDAADAIFLSGVGMPTLAMLQRAEDDFGKPVVSSASAMMWNALRIAGVRHPLPGFGRLLMNADEDLP
jgi:maleate isomerase